MVGVEIGLVFELSEDKESVDVLSEDGESVGVLVAKEDTAVEMTVVWLADWKPSDAARDDRSLAVVAGGTIELVLLSENLGTELAELLDEEERVWEIVDIRAPADELGVRVGDPKALPVGELELLAGVMVGNEEVLGVLVSDFVVAGPVEVTPFPVT